MNYVTTNVRLYHEDYQRLKSEAASKRKSLSAVIREKLSATSDKRSEAQVRTILAETKRVAARNGQKLHGFDAVKALHEMRYEHKW